MINPSDYYTNAAFDLSEQDQAEILAILEDYTVRIGKANPDPWVPMPQEAQKLISERNAYERSLERQGIKVGYGWPGHRGVWFFPTYDDALMYEDWLWHCTDYDYDEED